MKKWKFSGKLFTVQALWGWKKGYALYQAANNYDRHVVDKFRGNKQEKFEIVDDNELWDFNEKSPCCVNMREAVSVAQ